jgi:hypothetical protein
MAWSAAAGAQKCTPRPEIGVCIDNLRVGLGDTVTIRLADLDAFVGSCNLQELQLILNEKPLAGVAPLRVDPAARSIQFVLERPPHAPEVWTTIIAPPDFQEVHWAVLAVGFKDGVRTADVPLELVVFRRSALIGTATVAFLLLALIVWFCKSTSLIRVSGAMVPNWTCPQF